MIKNQKSPPCKKIDWQLIRKFNIQLRGLRILSSKLCSKNKAIILSISLFNCYYCLVWFCFVLIDSRQPNTQLSFVGKCGKFQTQMTSDMESIMLHYFLNKLIMKGFNRVGIYNIRSISNGISTYENTVHTSYKHWNLYEFHNFASNIEQTHTLSRVPIHTYLI